MYDVHIEVESLVYIYVYVGSRTIFFPVVGITRHYYFRFRKFLRIRWCVTENTVYLFNNKTRVATIFHNYILIVFCDSS